ncbi:MAG: PAS domain-containing protein, partial [Chthoniobacteraceae bacterium]
MQILASILFVLVTGGAAGAACWWLIRQRRSRLPLLLVLFTLLSWAGGNYLANRVVKKERTRLEQHLLGYAQIFAQQIQRLGHEQITINTPPDDPLYLELIQAQCDWLVTVPLAQDIYTMRLRPDGRAVLLVDSETDYDHNGDFLGESEQRTPIGELYEPAELDPGLQKAFTGEGNFNSIPASDRWGNWVTAAWPLFNSHHQVDAIIGIDYDASDYLATGREAAWRMFAYTTVLHLALIGTITLVASARWRSEDQARAAAEIKRTEDRFRVFMQHSPAVAFVKDEDGRYCFVNAAFEKQIGRSHQDVLGRNDSDLQSAIMALEMHQNDERVFETGCAIEVMESVSDRSGKTRKWWVAKFPLPEEGNRRQIGGVAIDVTAQSELEEQLRQTQKMESVGQLAAGIAHDFNNALTVISNCAELIEDAAADEKAARKHAKLIRRSAEGAAGLVQRLMQFSRKQPVQKRFVNIPSLLRQTEVMLSRTLGAQIAVHISAPDDLPAIVGDAVALEQV